MEGRKHGAHGASHAITQDAYARCSRAFTRIIQNIDHVAVDVVVQGQMAICIKRHAPVHEVSIKTLTDKAGHNASAFLEVQDVRAIYECVNEDNGRAIPWRSVEIMAQL